jgi:hypothetical protein
VRSCGPYRRARQCAFLVLMATFPAACAMPPPPPAAALPPANPFLGTWADSDHDRITFRPDTVVLDTATGPGTPLGKATCNGVFRFAYASRTRAELTALIPQQQDVRDKLAKLLTRPQYRVAALGCYQGDNTYVLLGDHEIVAIYRDGDIAGLDRMTRS